MSNLGFTTSSVKDSNIELPTEHDLIAHFYH